MSTLYRWGSVTWEVFPLNAGEVDHTTATDWSKKEIAGAANYREWVGEGDETIHIRGKVFPYFFANMAMQMTGNKSDNGRGGLSHLDILDNQRRMGQAHLLIRGDGVNLGWFVMETFSRGHSFLGAAGIGQQLTFEAVFQRVPVPDPTDYLTSFWASPTNIGVG